VTSGDDEKNEVYQIYFLLGTLLARPRTQAIRRTSALDTPCSRTPAGSSVILVSVMKSYVQKENQGLYQKHWTITQSYFLYQK
jgi:hypothetical protein